MGSSRRLAGRIDRILAHTVSLAGLTGIVVIVYLVIVVGLGHTPTHDQRSLLALSMAAAAVAALLYGPARQRLTQYANRIVYGEREAPDTVLRTFGSRLSRAIPMDELLLQVAESLRKTLGLAAAEVWTGSGGRLERTVSVPDVPVRRMTLNDEEATVVARAGVTGTAWVEIWLPSLLEGREDSIVRVAPTTHSGQVLGLIVAVRPPNSDQFTTDDDTMLTELARQVGLALHNVELDSALQESLDEVRRQADELRASRARIVAASDAARRQIERNLHDGAQQHLVALAVNVRLARQLAERDPEASGKILDQLGRRASRRPSRSCGPWPTASTRPCSSTGASARRCARRRDAPPCPPRSTPRASTGTRPSASRPSTSAASRRCRTRASTPARAPPPSCGCGRTTPASTSRCATPGRGSTPRARWPAGRAS